MHGSNGNQAMKHVLEYASQRWRRVLVASESAAQGRQEVQAGEPWHGEVKYGQVRREGLDLLSRLHSVQAGGNDLEVPVRAQQRLKAPNQDRMIIRDILELADLKLDY